jgi:hypothetical protein
VCTPGLVCRARAAGLVLAECFFKEDLLLNRFNTAILGDISFARKP